MASVGDQRLLAVAGARRGAGILPLFAITLFVSALLLFWVQPMFSRMVLPTLGGSPAVWNTAMVFFQTALLAGYLYAHLVSRWLGLRRQVALPPRVPDGGGADPADRDRPGLDAADRGRRRCHG